MNRNILLLLTFLLLSGISAALYLNRGTAKNDLMVGGMSVADRAFAVENRDDIYKVLLDRPRYPEMVFTREGERWKINGNLYLHDDMIGNLLTVLTKIKMEYIPGKAHTQNIYKDLEENGITIKIWDKDDQLLKSYQVGTEVANGNGVPYLMEGEKQPYIMYIPGFEGSVRTRLTYNLNELRSKDLFRENPDKLSSIEVIYPRDTKSSYVVNRSNSGQYSIRRPGEASTDAKTNQKTATHYYSRFKKKVAEYNDAENRHKEEITAQPVFAHIKTVDETGEEKTYKLYSYADLTTDIITVSPKEIHPDNKFFVVTNTGEFLLVQYRVIKDILQTYNYFLN